MVKTLRVLAEDSEGDWRIAFAPEERLLFVRHSDGKVGPIRRVRIT